MTTCNNVHEEDSVFNALMINSHCAGFSIFWEEERNSSGKILLLFSIHM